MADFEAFAGLVQLLTHLGDLLLHLRKALRLQLLSVLPTTHTVGGPLFTCDALFVHSFVHSAGLISLGQVRRHLGEAEQTI